MKVIPEMCRSARKIGCIFVLAFLLLLTIENLIAYSCNHKER